MSATGQRDLTLQKQENPFDLTGDALSHLIQKNTLSKRKAVPLGRDFWEPDDAYAARQFDLDRLQFCSYFAARTSKHKRLNLITRSALALPSEYDHPEGGKRRRLSRCRRIP
jgi:hypothetical protein